MKRNMLLFVVSVIIALGLITSTANAQYTAGGNYLGPSIGFAFLGSTPDFGASYEYGINMENFGLVGIGGIFRYWGYSDSYFEGQWKYTNVLIGVQGNYHFVVSNNKWDPYAGLVLAYDAGSVSWSGPSGYNYSSPTYGGMWLAAQGGLRYWISPTVAITGRIGFGTLSYSGLDFGVDFKF